jgi:hypothetical protein
VKKFVRYAVPRLANAPAINMNRLTRRRYYLHRKVKKFIKIDAYRKILYYSDDLFEQLTDQQVRYFVELQLVHQYSAQQEIEPSFPTITFVPKSYLP